MIETGVYRRRDERPASDRPDAWHVTAGGRVAVLLACVLLLAAWTVPAGGQATGEDGHILGVSYDGVEIEATDDTYGWLADDHRFTVTVGSSSGLEDASICLRPGDTEADRPPSLACASTSVASDEPGEVEITVEDWPANLTGEREIEVLLSTPDRPGEALDYETVAVTVLEAEADADEDGLANRQEVEVGTDPVTADTDGDGLADGREVNSAGTSPLATDTDEDGLSDRAEVDDHGTDPTAEDTDGDGLPDNLEVNTYDTDPTDVDTDGDGLEDGAEVERHQTDPTAADTDGDGLEDGAELDQYGTDPTAADTDGDGLEDGTEVLEHGTDPTEADTDGDGVNDREAVQRATDDGLGLTQLLGLAVLGVVAVAGLAVLVLGRSLPRLPRPRRLRGAGEADEEDEPAGDDDLPDEFLPDHERVLRILEEHDGRIRQSEIVEGTDWSKSKVSRVLSRMEEEDRIRKIDVGRGNVITRPEDAPAAVQSPSED